ncbi:hypothetical protein, partial [Roseibium sp. RKSG952]|uniref:hypothetical protein n=1 Tax=Roseibium sp. RKSG952 TaxID=2529384 RepID=UPI0013C84C21
MHQQRGSWQSRTSWASIRPGTRNTANGWFNSWLRGGFLAEDLPKARETLELFSKYRTRLGGSERDIGQYQTLADIWKVVKRFNDADLVDAPLSGKQKRLKDKEQAYAEALVLLDEPDCTVAVPMTVEAAKWWGRGTRWCTSAESNNAFLNYHLEAPLIVIDLKSAGKFQLWVTKSRKIPVVGYGQRYSEPENSSCGLRAKIFSSWMPMMPGFLRMPSPATRTGFCLC